MLRGGRSRCELVDLSPATSLEQPWRVPWQATREGKKASKLLTIELETFFFSLLPLSSMNRFMKQQKLTFHVFLLALNCFLVEKRIETSFSRLLSARRVWRESEETWKEVEARSSWRQFSFADKWIEGGSEWSSIEGKEKKTEKEMMNQLHCKLFAFVVLALAVTSISGKVIFPNHWFGATINFSSASASLTKRTWFGFLSSIWCSTWRWGKNIARNDKIECHLTWTFDGDNAKRDD